MARCRLDLSHPSFQKSIARYKDDSAFQEGLATAKAKIEAEHASCHRVVQRMGPKYPECHGKIWKYDWAPVNQSGSSRKSCRMVVIVPDPNQQPYELIAGGIYYKSTRSRLSDKEFAAIYAEIAGPRRASKSTLNAEDFRFNEMTDSQGVIHVVCLECATMIIESSSIEQVSEAEMQHQCSESN